MRHTMVKLTGLLVVLALTLTGCNLIGVDPMMQLDEDFAALDKDYATVVAEYDGGTITKGEALGSFASMYSYYAQMYSMFGMNMTADVVENIKQQTLETAVQAKAVAKEIESRGLSLAEDKLAEVQKAADDSYQQAYDSFFEHAEGKGDVKARQTEYDMYTNGYTKDLFYQSQLEQANLDLLEEDVKSKVELSEEDLKAAYDEKVTEDEEKYASDASAFETAMSSEDDIVAWIPEGYRTVKHILVVPEEDLLTAVTDASGDVTDAEEALEELETELEDLNDADPEAEADEAAEEEPAEEPAEPVRTAEQINADIEATRAKLEAAQKAVEDAKAACLESVKAKTDEIYAKIEAGEDFGSLIEQYGEDPGMKNEPTASRGYYVCAEQGNWDKSFNEGAMSLQNVGDVTATPVVSTSGVHIIRYESDVTPGPVALETVHDKFYETTLETRQDAEFTETLSAITAALNPVYHLDAFNVG